MPISTIGSNSLNQTSDLTINGQTVGKGGGNVASNTVHGVSALSGNSSGTNNTAVGYQALTANTANSNTAFGWSTLLNNTSGSPNNAFGNNALITNTTGGWNVALGHSALYTNNGSYNIAVGGQALYSNTTASYNVAVGYQAGYSTTGSTSSFNVFLGVQSGYSATSGNSNVVVGSVAGYSLTTGTNNTFVGCNTSTASCGYYMTTGSKNTILGGYSGNQDSLDIRTESNNIVLSDGDGNVRMHYRGSDASWKSLAIYNNTTGSGANMTVLSSGTIARSTSSLKYKRDVQDATHGLAEVLQLRPVTYKGKGENDGETVFGGLIAEEVHAAGLTEFVQYADDGTPDALAYGNMVSLLVKSIQELKTIVDAQAAEIAELKAKVA